MKCGRESCRKKAWAHGRFCEFHTRQRRQAGLSGRHNPEPLRRHIAGLVARGFTTGDIADMAGVCQTYVYQHLMGRRKTARAEEASRVLAIPADAPLPFRRRKTVDGVGIPRRIQALGWMGWSHKAIADEIGVSHRVIQEANCRPVPRVVAAALVVAYERLQFQRGPSEMTAGKARARGYAPPAAWDDIDNDPEPSTGSLSRSRVDEDDVRHLRRMGLSNAEIAKKMGVSPEYLRDKVRAA